MSHWTISHIFGEMYFTKSKTRNRHFIPKGRYNHNNQQNILVKCSACTDPIDWLALHVLLHINL